MIAKLICIAAAIACTFAAGEAQANGTDPTVVAGQASFSTQGGALNITNSPGAIINWQGFSINAGETTRFIQQSVASSVLNRVTGSDPSVILGTLTSNGRVFLINPSGILFGQGARIDVAGLVASTLNLSNQDFLAGRLNFAANSLAGTVENQGSITTPSGGSVYLVGANVTNSGIINSPKGDVILAAGQSVNILDSSTPGVRVELTASDNTAVNLGEIIAQSGQVGIYGAALRNAGLINADQVGRDASGKIVLRAKKDVTLEAGSRLSANGEQAGGAITVQSEAGTALASGTIEAKATAGNGGTVKLLGKRVGLITASVDASGTTGGGTVLVGGNFHGAGPEQNALATTVAADSSINADAINSGNGGKIAVWSDGDTSVAGTLTARAGANSGDGGFIETSGKHLSIADSARVNTLAANGKAGTWLLDPYDFTIAASGDDITGAALTTALGSGAVTIQTAVAPASCTGAVCGPGNSAGNGDIFVNDAVSWATNQLTLTAFRDININAVMTASGGASLALNPGTGMVVTGRDASGNFIGRVDFSGVGTLGIGGTTYTVINSLGAASSITGTDLQGMNGGLATNYALGSNIDATATAGWNAGAGFAPITLFTGTFDGLGHTITGLTINRPVTASVGLFGASGTISTFHNVGLVGGSVIGAAGTGGLVGTNGAGSTVNNSYNTGSVSGAAGTGGLVGDNGAASAISNSYSTGSVSGAAGTGGLAGTNTTGAISNSYATGIVSGSGAGTGGLVGSSTSGAFTNNYATGTVTGIGASTGGLIGSNTSGAVSNSYATGHVNGGGVGVGGLIGSNTSGALTESYAAGLVDGGGTSLGGLMGSNTSGAVTRSFWDITTSTRATSTGVGLGGGIGMTTAEMQTQANFTSATTANGSVNPAWGFPGTWVMYDGYTYPLLQSFMTQLTVTANNATKTYDRLAYSGSGGVTYSVTPNANLLGTLSYTGGINAGSYTITPSGQYSNQQGYIISFANGTLTVNPKALSQSGLSVAASKIYDATTGTTLIGASALAAQQAAGTGTTADGISYIGDTVSLTGTSVGTYDFKDVATASTVTFSGLTLAGAQATNYTLTPHATQAATITAKALMIVADALSKVYGATDPALTYVANGFQVGDSAGTVLSGVLSRATGENVGNYAIGKNTLASNANYTVTYTGNNLGITPAPLNVAAHPQNKLFGTPDPALTFGITGLVNNLALGIADTAGSVISGALTRVPGESALGGPYAITQGTLAANSNYSLGFTASNLVIIGAAAEPVLGFSALQVIFAGVINDEFYYRPGNFWHISLNYNNADPGFDVMRGTNELNSRLNWRLNSCDSVFGGGFCETWKFPQQFRNADKKR